MVLIQEGLGRNYPDSVAVGEKYLFFATAAAVTLLAACYSGSRVDHIASMREPPTPLERGISLLKKMGFVLGQTDGFVMVLTGGIWRPAHGWLGCHV